MNRTARAYAGTATLVALLAAAAWLLWPASLGGRTTYVTTHGVSMEPRFHSGDLAVLRPATAYHVGDVVAYHNHMLHTVVMHRIVAVSNDRYTFKGDNNSWLDPEKATRSQLIGKLAIRIAGGGVWLKRASNPTVLAALAFALAASGGTVATTRRKRRRRTMSRHAAPRARSASPMTSLSPQLRTAASATAALGLLGLALGALAWTQPLEKVATSTTTPKRSMTFSYTAAVPKTPAYDGTTVTSPDPVFRKLADTVAVHYAYRGTPGSVSVAAELSTASGWHSTVRLAGPTTFASNRYDADVRLDLNALDARAQAAARVIGIPATQLTVAVVTDVHGGSGVDFTPALSLVLTPSQLALNDQAKSLSISDSTTVVRHTTVSRTLSFAHRAVTVALARRISTGLLLLALVAAAVLTLVVRRSAGGSEAARIRRRYAPLLVPVAPMPTPPGRPVIDVTEFATLARLAERYGLLVLHWTRSGVDTFVVQDDATTYRYRAGSGAGSGSHAESPAVATTRSHQHPVS